MQRYIGSCPYGQTSGAPAELRGRRASAGSHADDHPRPTKPWSRALFRLEQMEAATLTVDASAEQQQIQIGRQTELS